MSRVYAVTPSQYSEQEILASVLAHSQSSDIPVAVWRLPGTNDTNVIISDDYEELAPGALLEDMDPGFLFSPFDKSGARIFLRAHKLLTFRQGKLEEAVTPLGQESHRWLREVLPASPARTFVTQPREVPLPVDIDKGSFLRLVEKGIREIERGTFHKIVPSRTRVVTLPESFDVVASFQKLCASYPLALISYVSIPGVGTWLGASPEILVCVQGKKIFRTVALAGTLPYSAGVDTRSVAWTQKEIEEQALVERYVISCFKKIRLREYDEHGPRTVVAGNLMHLKSEFTVDIEATNFPQLGSVMLDLLHPTSAVCGMPLEPSLAFLKAHEPHDRGFYSGYLGPVNINNDIDVFVNLRCMQIAGPQAILYAGAGVTIDSIAEQEWAETEMKFDTLVNVIF